MEKITALRLKDSGITKLPDLSKFTNLKSLDLQYNRNIENIQIVGNITSLKSLGMIETYPHGKMPNFSKLTNLKSIDLKHNQLWSEDLENLKALKNNTGLTIDLIDNSIVDASALLEFDSSNISKIYLGGNVNLTQESKDKLTAKFGSKVEF